MILPDLIKAHALKSPDRTALIFRDKTISYGELHRQIERCANGLISLGVKKGNPFGLLLRNCPEFVILSMALSKIGAVTVPINFLEKPDRISLILNDAKAVGLLTAREFSKTAAEAAKSIPTLKFLYVREIPHQQFKSFDELLQHSSITAPDNAVESDLMMLLYTSGTTGLPKGVMLTHKNFLANVDQCLGSIDVKPRDRFLCLLPLFHSFSWTACMMVPLKLGAMIVIIESLLPFDPVIKAIWKYKITHFVAVPQIYGALVAKIQGFKAFVIRLLNPVKICISGAAPLPPGIHQNFEKRFGVPLVEGYGLTEVAPVASLNPTRKRKTGTVGLPLPGVEIQIHDDEGKALPQGEVGEIWIRGDNVMSGYYNKPKETKEALTDDGWLITGDLGKFDEDGYLTIVDRKKDLIIVKGLNVYPQEIENVIAEDPTVKEVAVVGKMDKETGEEVIRAFVTVKEGVGLDKHKIFELCRQRLAAYKRPKDIIVIDEMPKNALQKILKKDLRER